MSDNNTRIGLSRRRMLGGLGAIGVASAGAGLGTTAFFSDSESFETNTLTAGQFELHVTQSTRLVDQDGIGPDEQTFDEMTAEEQIDGETVEVLDGFLDIEDAKPGDSYRYCWDICVKHNPGYVEITLDSEESTGNDSDVGHVDASGTLGEYVLAVVTIDDQRAGDQTDVVFAGTLGELVAEWEDGGLVHAAANFIEFLEEEVVEYCHLPCESDVDGGRLSPDEDGVELCVDLYVPSHADIGEEVEVAGTTFGPLAPDDSPGNLVQGASFEADVRFGAEQCRHNDRPFGGKYDSDATAIETVLDGLDAEPRGFGTASDAQTGAGSWQSVGSNKETLYLGPDPDFVDFDTLPAFTVGEIDEISYWTNKDGGPSGVDFYLLIYTAPVGDGNDDASWYNKRLNAEPYFLSLAGDQIVAPANQWNEWSTAGTGDTAPLRFVDANRTGIDFGYGDGVMPTLQDLQSGSIDWSSLRNGGESTSIDYDSQNVRSLAISTGSPWNVGFDGLLDSIGVKLTDGTELVLDLEV